MADEPADENGPPEAPSPSPPQSEAPAGEGPPPPPPPPPPPEQPASTAPPISGAPPPVSRGGSGQRKRRGKKAAEPDNARIGFVGAGKVAGAIINGFVIYGKIEPKRIFVAAPTPTNADVLKLNFKGLRTSKRNIDIFGRFDCDIVFICVNPHVIRNLYKMGGLRPVALTTNYIPNMKHVSFVLSLVFGFTIAQIKECLLNPENFNRYLIRFHRAVVSCAVAYGIGHCYIDVEPDSTKMHELIRQLLGLISKFEYMPENLMDACCTVVGAGLSFCYYFINAMSDGALRIGLTRATSIKFTAKVASVAAQTVLETGKQANSLRDEASSPMGGAIYGITILDKGEVSSGVTSGVEAAHKRAQALATKGNVD